MNPQVRKQCRECDFDEEVHTAQKMCPNCMRKTLYYARVRTKPEEDVQKSPNDALELHKECPHCGHDCCQITVDDAVCTNCGESVVKARTKSRRKKKPKKKKWEHDFTEDELNNKVDKALAVDKPCPADFVPKEGGKYCQCKHPAGHHKEGERHECECGETWTSFQSIRKVN